MGRLALKHYNTIYKKTPLRQRAYISEYSRVVVYHSL